MMTMTIECEMSVPLAAVSERSHHEVGSGVSFSRSFLGLPRCRHEQDTAPRGVLPELPERLERLARHRLEAPRPPRAIWGTNRESAKAW